MRCCCLVLRWQMKKLTKFTSDCPGWLQSWSFGSCWGGLGCGDVLSQSHGLSACYLKEPKCYFSLYLETSPQEQAWLDNLI